MDSSSPNSKVAPVDDPSSIYPEVGMKFCSEEEAYNFYNEYAKGVGFSIRKYHVERRKDGSLKSRKFVCSNEGTRGIHRTHITKKPQPIKRTNCKARVEFKIDKSNVWTLWRVELDHNHPMISPNKIHMLRSHRKVLPFQREFIDQMTRSDIKLAQIYNFFQDGAKQLENVGYIRTNNNNYVGTRRRKFLRASEVQGLLQYLKGRQASEPSFFYAIQIHETGEVANFFWVDGRAIMDYAYFGDIISFEYEMPFAPMLGLNHHKQTIVFGAALLFDETIDSFVWLFETFMTAMSGKQPLTIFTVQSDAISKAIEIVFPKTCHRLCLWNIFQNATTNLNQVIHACPKFIDDFSSCIYECSTVEKFTKKWDNMITNYNLFENKWLQNVFNIKEKWAAIYHLDSFCAGMATAQKNDSITSHFKKFLKRKLSLFECIDEYDKAVQDFRQKELYEDFKSRETKPIQVFRNNPMLNKAAEAYTRTMYHEFAAEFTSQLLCICELISSDGTFSTFKISIVGREQEDIVIFGSQDSTVKCSCKMFETKGILCMHAIRVLLHNNVLNFPLHYILKRWTKHAKDGGSSNVQETVIDSSGKEKLTSIYARVCQKEIAISTKCLHHREALESLEKGIDKITLEVEEMLRNAKLSDIETEMLPDSFKQASSNVMVDESTTNMLPLTKKDLKLDNMTNMLERKKRKISKTSASSQDDNCIRIGGDQRQNIAFPITMMAPSQNQGEAPQLTVQDYI